MQQQKYPSCRIKIADCHLLNNHFYEISIIFHAPCAHDVIEATKKEVKFPIRIRFDSNKKWKQAFGSLYAGCMWCVCMRASLCGRHEKLFMKWEEKASEKRNWQEIHIIVWCICIAAASITGKARPQIRWHLGFDCIWWWLLLLLSTVLLYFHRLPLLLFSVHTN